MFVYLYFCFDRLFLDIVVVDCSAESAGQSLISMIASNARAISCFERLVVYNKMFICSV